MSRFSGIISVFIVLTAFTLMPVLTSCGNDGVTPPTITKPLENPIIPVVPDVNPVDDNKDPVKNDDPLNPDLARIGDISTEDLYDLGCALEYLIENGGGVMSIELEPDQFALHLWDEKTGAALTGSAVVVCSGGPTTLVNVPGAAAYDNASFPLTLTARVDGYALSTIAGTSANVISIRMRRSYEPGDAYIFGVTQNYGGANLQIYTDTLITEKYFLSGSVQNPMYTQYKFPVASDMINGFSAFIIGSIQPVSFNPEYFVSDLSAHFAWDLAPISPGDHRFYGISFSNGSTPLQTASGVASLPSGLFTNPSQLASLYACAIPTAIFVEGERYLAIGPETRINGSELTNIPFSCKYFTSQSTPDAYTMAGQYVMPDGSANIIHAAWQPGQPAPALNFSGFPKFGVTGTFQGAISLPVFTITDPLDESDFNRIETRAMGMGSVWDITLASGSEVVQTSDFQVPLTWLASLQFHLPITFRLECLDTAGFDIDSFTEDHIILTREESSFSPWTEPKK